MSEKGLVLVVDDHEAQRELVSIDLEDNGFDVCDAHNGRECLERAATNPQPDVILLDIEMPGMSGIDVCRALREDPRTAAIPVLFMTGWRDDDPMIVEALSAGGNDFVNKTTSVPVLVARLRTQVAMRRAQLRVEQMAMRDALTGLFTRHFLFEAMRSALKAQSRSGTVGLGCLLADIDHFKSINDTLGHLEGDEALRRVAGLLEHGVRETDVVSRFGGEEFLVLLPHTGADGAAQVAEKLRAEVEAHARCTISVGVSWQGPCAPDELADEETLDGFIRRLIARADRAMYQAKESGRNLVRVFTADSID